MNPSQPLAAAGAFADFGIVAWSHRHCELRALAAVTPPRERLATIARALVDRGFQEVVLLSTCNRFAVLYSRGSGEAIDPVREICAELCEAVVAPPVALRGIAALEHLCAVAASLDSLVVGERQITRQLRDAVRAAGDYGTVGPLLRRATGEAFRVARSVRRDTRLVRGASVASLAVEQLARRLETAAEPVVALVGAGAMTEQTALLLAKRLPVRCIFINRTLAKAEALAARFGGEAMSLERFAAAPPAVDAMVSATAAPLPVIGRAVIARLAAHGRSVFYIDLAIPFDVDAAAAREHGCALLTIEDLRAEADRRAAAQVREVEHARELVARRIACVAQRESSERAIRAFAERRAEAERRARAAVPALAPVGASVACALEGWAVGASRRIAHVALRHGVDGASSRTLLDAELRRLDPITRRLSAAEREQVACGWAPSTLAALAGAFESRAE